jgi:N-acetylglucosaminyldiphosphoundecaprenol N-acetyl-beta-D-mannosaminyltransferase
MAGFTKNLGNVRLAVLNAIEALEFIKDRTVHGNKTKLFFVNAHCYNVAQKDAVYRDILNDAELVLNDGVGVEWGAKISGFRFKENMNGTDFVPQLMRLAEQLHLSVYLLGAASNVSERAARRLQQQFPDLKIAGYHDGFFTDHDKMINEINEAFPDILIVAMGVPLQEKWIHQHMDNLNTHLAVGVGAFLDFASGQVSRSPKWVRAFKMEWVYRLMLEPRRLWKRYLVGNLLFFYYMFKSRMKAEKTLGLSEKSQ